jgi:hypothetical protein
MGQVIDYVLGSGRNTSRKTCPIRLLAESKQWHRAIYENLELCSVADGSFVSSDSEFNNVMAVPWSNGRVVVTPIRTVGALIREGKKMRSCAGSRARDALQGHCSFYSVKIDGTPITVEVTLMPKGRSFVSEMGGYANRAVEDYELSAMKPWLASIGTASDSLPTRSTLEIGGHRNDP